MGEKEGEQVREGRVEDSGGNRGEERGGEREGEMRKGG